MPRKKSVAIDISDEIKNDVKPAKKSKKKSAATTKTGTSRRKTSANKGKPQEDKSDLPLLDRVGSVCKSFILENIRLIDYRDLAKLTGVDAEELKGAVEAIGIKLPVDKARPWKEIDVGSFKSLFDCARCQVQLNHNTFFVGMNNCRKCMEKNIKHWIETNIKIDLHFRRN